MCISSIPPTPTPGLSGLKSFAPHLNWRKKFWSSLCNEIWIHHCICTCTLLLSCQLRVVIAEKCQLQSQIPLITDNSYSLSLNLTCHGLSSLLHRCCLELLLSHKKGTWLCNESKEHLRNDDFHTYHTKIFLIITLILCLLQYSSESRISELHQAVTSFSGWGLYCFMDVENNSVAVDFRMRATWVCKSLRNIALNTQILNILFLNTLSFNRVLL